MPITCLTHPFRLLLSLTLTCALLGPAAAAAAEAPALLTLLDGEATVVVGARAFAAAPGARLAPGSLVETDANTSLLRLEWPDGSMLDLGPGTRVMLRPALAGTAGTAGARMPLFYLLQGWAKQTQEAATSGQLCAGIEVPAFKGVLVSQVDNNTAVLFSEAGGEQLSARRSGAPLKLMAGQAAVLFTDGNVQVLPRPPAGWLARMPRSFRDTLARRAAQFKGPPPTLKPRGPLNYAALQPWLSAEAALRQDFPQRFAELLTDPNFRAAVAARVAQHPEWDVVLHPPHSLRAASAARKAQPSTPSTALEPTR